jgi:hypothetical protein
LATWAWKRAAWSSASFSSEKPLAYSRPVMNSSKRSVMAGLAVGCAGQRRHLHRVVDDEGGLPQLVFDRRLEQAELQLGQLPVRRRLLAQRLQAGVQHGGVVGLGRRQARMHHQRVAHRQPRKGLVQATGLPA